MVRILYSDPPQNITIDEAVVRWTDGQEFGMEVTRISPDSAARLSDYLTLHYPPEEPAPVDALSPKLQSVDGSVIIRRGDSLWRISHRVYGRGLRYSTIYLANQKQIDDPDRIYPGQVFSVPSKTEKGEEADFASVLAESLRNKERG